MNLKKLRKTLGSRTADKFLAGFLAVVIVICILCPSGIYFNSAENYELALATNDNSVLDFNQFVFKNKLGDSEFVKVANSSSRKISVDVVNDMHKRTNLKKHFRYSISQNHALLNGNLLAASTKDKQVFESKDGHKFKKQNIVQNEFDFKDELLNSPSVGALLSGVSKVTNAAINFKPLTKVDHPDEQFEHRALTRSEDLREIEYYAVLPEDFSSDVSEEDLLAEVLRVTFNANQYLKDINLMLIPIGVKIYRGTSRFSSALGLRDPYQMLSLGVDERRDVVNQLKEKSGDLLVVFSRSYFSRATGLAYLTTACSNPMYSVVFASGGSQTPGFELSLAGVLAHETGHYLGMTHDDSYYSLGLSLMSTRQVSMPYGFSSRSKGEQSSYSGKDLDGGSCLTLVNSGNDSDKDGVKDAVEEMIGSDPFDRGSYYDSQTGKMFMAWNQFASQEIVGEFGNPLDVANSVNVSIRDAEGQLVAPLKIELQSRGEQDILFSSMLANHKNTYGLFEINTNLKFNGRSSVYSFNGGFEKFNYVSQQSAFKGLREYPIFLPYNNILPNTMPKGSRVDNWITLANTGDVVARFRVRTFSALGSLNQDRYILVPAKGRRDISGDYLAVPNSYGFHQIEIVDRAEDASFNAFLNRYYIDPSGKIISSALVEGKVPSGVKKHFVHNARPRSRSIGLIPLDGWIEIVNSLIVGNAVKIKAELPSGEVILDRLIELSPYASTHVQLPSFSKEYIISIESLKPEGLSIFAAKYSNESGQHSVEALKFEEELKVEKSTSYNTFINTVNDLLVTNSTKKKGTVVCKIFADDRVLENTFNLTANSFDIFQLDSSFPEFGKNRYATITCDALEPDFTPIPTSMRIDRFIEGRHVIENLMK